MKLSPLAVLISFLLAGTLAAQSSTWTGSVNSRWDHAQNWTNGVPSQGVDAIIDPAPNPASTATASGPRCRDLIVQAGAVLDVIPGHALKVFGSSILHGSITGGGDIACVGTGTISAPGGNPYPEIEIFGTYAFVGDVTMSTDLEHQPGAGPLTFGAGTVTAVNKVVIEGETIIGEPGSILVSLGSTQIIPSNPCITPPEVIRVHGNWESNANFTPTSGLVSFDGNGVQGINMPALTFFSLRIGLDSSVALNQAFALGGDLCIEGTVTVGSIAIIIGGQLKVSGSFSSGDVLSLTVGAGVLVESGTINMPHAILDIDGEFDSMGGTLTFGEGNHVFSGGMSLATSTFDPAPTDCFLFDGSGEIFSDIPLPTIKIGGIYTLLDLVIAGDLTQRPEAGALSFDGMQTVEGNALFEGETLLEAAAAPGSVLDILGDGSSLTREDVVHPPLTINVSGNWTTNNRWLALTGVVNFQGMTPVIITTPQVTTTSVTLGSGSQITLQGTTTLTVQGSLTIQGQLAAPPQTMVTNDLIVPALSQLDVTATTTVAGSVINDGDITGAGTLKMDGTGMLTGAGNFGNVAVDTASSILIENTTGQVNGAFTISNGSVNVAAGNQFTVLGASAFDGGILSGDAASILNLDGSANFAGTVAGASVPDISVAGDWTADENFAPTMGSVILDGSADSLLSASVEGGTLNFNDLQIVGGRRIVGTDFFLNAPTVTIAAGAALSIGSAQPDDMLDDAGSSLGYGGGQMSIDGLLEIDRAELCLELGSVLTSGTGSTLRMTGTPNLPATICGPPCGNYEVNIGGRFEALNFQFLDMGSTGIRILDTASIGAAPFDMRAGLFADGAPGPGSVQLDIASNVAREFRDISFERQLADMPEFNVRTTTTSTITFKNFSGNFSGPAFEDDPNDVIEWAPEMRTVMAFNANSAIGRVNLQFTSSREVDLTNLRLFRMVGNSGIFTEMPDSPITPLGSQMTGASYSVIDFNVVFPTRYSYRLEEDLVQGGSRVLGTDAATPREAMIGESLFVGAGGFADIGAAVMVAEKGSNIIVAAGTYPAFVLDRPVRIMSDGSGPFLVDTLGSKLSIRNIPAGESDIAIYDMQIIAPSGGPTGIEISNCDNVIILDNVQIDGASGVTALTIDDCRHVALQNCRLEGTDGLVVSNNSEVFISGGTISTLNAILMSKVTHVATNIGTSSNDSSSVISSLTGSSPRMEFPNLWPTSERVLIELSADPGDFWCIIQSGSKSFFDLNILIPTEMILLLDPFQPLGLLRCGNMPPTGQASGELPVVDDSSLWGMNTSLQMFVTRPPFLRLGNVRDAVFLPPGN